MVSRSSALTAPETELTRLSRSWRSACELLHAGSAIGTVVISPCCGSAVFVWECTSSGLNSVVGNLLFDAEGNQRFRTWQVKMGNDLLKIVHVDEKRTARTNHCSWRAGPPSCGRHRTPSRWRSMLWITATESNPLLFQAHTVTPGPADFLIIGFDAAGYVGVENETHVGFIDSHPEGDGCHHHYP